jgi:phosphatidylinositol alpha-1,6-mannosyltransferase
MKIGVILRIKRPSGPAKISIKEVEYLNKIGVEARLFFSKDSNYYDYFYQDLLRNIPWESIVRGVPAKVCTLFTTPLRVLVPTYLGGGSVIDPFSLLLAGLKIPKLDMVVCHDIPEGIVGLLLYKLRGIPYVCYTHELISYSVSLLRISNIGVPKAIHLMEKAVLQNAKRVISQSQHSRKNILAYHPFLKNKTSVLYPGCEPIKKPLFNKQNYIIAVSRWGLGRDLNDPRCRSAVFIIDIAKQVNSNITFMLVGSWDSTKDKNAFKKLLRKRGLEKKVELVSNVSERELQQLYMNASMMLHWAIEGFGMCVLEAMACGCPVITIDGTGAAEIIKNGTQGFIVKNRDPKKYAQCIKLLLENNDLSRRISLEAWKTAQSYDWENHTKNLIEFLK